MTEKHEINLNNEYIRTDGYDEKIKDFSRTGAGTSVYFKNLESCLVDLIGRAHVVVGCVAWMTNRPILEALRRKAGVSIIVQKEDFLRPDAGKLHKPSLRKLYDSLTSLDRSGFRLLGSMSTSGPRDLEAVRCVGVRSSPVSPKMHHKFAVFCERRESNDSAAEEAFFDDYIVPVPYAVWTGSFNFTYTGTCSFENAVYIEDPEISRAYFNEWEQVAALSEPLDWERPYVAPEWRIGT